MVASHGYGDIARTHFGAICRQILDVSLKVRRGERVWINGWDHTVDLVSDLARGCQSRGCEVLLTLRSGASWFASLQGGPVSPFKRMTPRQRAILEETDSYIFTLGPRNPIDWRKVPDRRRRLATLWLLEDNDFVKEWVRVARRRRVKMLGVEATLATEERARALGVNYEDWRHVMRDGCLADAREMSSRARKLSRSLGSSARVQIGTPSGTHLEFRLDGRRVETSDGIVSEQKARSGTVVFLPAGGVGTTVDERSAEGTIAYDGPIRFPHGRVERLEIRLEAGRIVDWHASAGIEAFEKHLESAKGDADRFGFLGIGLNPRLRLGYTQDDKVLGSVELNFGENRSRGGRNRGHGDWWGVVAESTIIVGDCKIMDHGRLLV